MKFHLLLFFLKQQKLEIPHELLCHILDYNDFEFIKYQQEKRRKRLLKLEEEKVRLEQQLLISKLNLIQKTCNQFHMQFIILSIQPKYNKILKDIYLSTTLQNQYITPYQFSSTKDNKYNFNFKEVKGYLYNDNCRSSNRIKFCDGYDEDPLKLTKKVGQEIKAEPKLIIQMDKLIIGFSKDPDYFDDCWWLPNTTLVIVIDDLLELQKYCMNHINLNKKIINYEEVSSWCHIENGYTNYNFGISEYLITMWDI